MHYPYMEKGLRPGVWSCGPGAPQVQHEPSTGTRRGLAGVRPGGRYGSLSLATKGLGARGEIEESIPGVAGIQNRWSQASDGEW
jgi:hypothetical protein